MLLRSTGLASSGRIHDREKHCPTFCWRSLAFLSASQQTLVQTTITQYVTNIRLLGLKKWNLGCITYYQVQSLTLSDKKLTLGYLLLKQKARYSIAGDAGPVSDSSVHVDVVMAAKEPWQYLALLATAWRFYLGGSLRRHSIFLVESQSPTTGMHDGEYIRAHGTLHMSTKKVHRHQSMDPNGQDAYQSQLGRWENMEPQALCPLVFLIQ